MTAVEMIAAERARQIEAEGYSSGHDSEHESNELAWAAVAYAMPYTVNGLTREELWPWPRGDGFKPSPDDRIRELVKAGALIAAEIDRLQREALEVVAEEAK